MQAPDVLRGGRVDRCDGCPDMTVWDGKIVHSCRLDEHRTFGQYVIPVLKEKADVPASG